MGRRLALLVAAVALCVPAAASANGDPASDYLLVQNVFLPFNAKIDPGVAGRLSRTVQAAWKSGFKIRVALIVTRFDLGTAFSLYNKPQRYAEFLGLELSFVYRGRLLVVMPKGFGYSVDGKPDPQAAHALTGLAGPGKDATKQAEEAAVAIRRLASAAGHRLGSGGGGGASAARDRIAIGAAATAGIALIAALVLLRRQRRNQAG